MGDKERRTQRYIDKLQEAIPSAENGMIMISVDAANELIDLLKEQKPVAPIANSDPKGNARYLVCGSCEGLINVGDNFCRKCGRPVKWVDEERDS